MAIVDMIDRSYRQPGNKIEVVSECILAHDELTSKEGNTSIEEVFERYVSMEKRFLDSFGVSYDKALRR